MDGRNPAPPKRPWRDDSPVNTNKQWFPMVSKWGRILSIHSTSFLAGGWKGAKEAGVSKFAFKQGALVDFLEVGICAHRPLLKGFPIKKFIVISSQEGRTGLANMQFICSGGLKDTQFRVNQQSLMSSPILG